VERTDTHIYEADRLVINWEMDVSLRN